MTHSHVTYCPALFAKSHQSLRTMSRPFSSLFSISLPSNQNIIIIIIIIPHTILTVYRNSCIPLKEIERE